MEFGRYKMREKEKELTAALNRVEHLEAQVQGLEEKERERRENSRDTVPRPTSESHSGRR